ncbi:S41 family peptidase [Anatilimnocola floriformis]|uniref:S41 family peptidase n=1 Tax=Anatilimnocola floriformis TaxID=2948575 RepID=UPI0020C4A9B7|nr:S41 family peptidase [Anatilimnocola floriformis]
MPLRNIAVIFLAMIGALVCYRTASRNRHVGTLAQAMNLVVEHYVDEVDDRQLFEGAMVGMIDKLDSNSKYTPPEDLPQFQEAIDQEFPGIGIIVEFDNEAKRLRIKSPIPKLPAFRAGLKRGDIILQIDGHDTENKSLPECTKLIRGPEGSKVKLQVRRKSEKEPLSFDVVREKIPIESVKGDRHNAAGEWIYTLQDHPRLGYIRIITFGERTVDELKAALEKFGPGAQQIDGLILDLRGNPGGLLTAGVGVCDAFLDEGLIVSTRGRGKVELEAHKAHGDLSVPKSLPIVVLVDSYSASASEIVAACLQDHQRATIIGQRTYGKGTVQKVYMLEGNKSALRLTFATYWRPNNKDIHKRKGAKDSDDWGVRPDAGQEVVISKELREQLLEARLNRDLDVIDGVSEPPTKTETPKDGNGEKPPAIPVPEADPDEINPADVAKPIPVDPQLKRAVEFLLVKKS